MSYKYYQEIETEEHYYYASEISWYLLEKHGISSPNGTKPASTMVNAMLNFLHAGEPKLYYNTRNGLKRVWPQGKTAAALLVRNCVEPGGCIEINGKKYHYKKIK